MKQQTTNHSLFDGSNAKRILLLLGLAVLLAAFSAHAEVLVMNTTAGGDNNPWGPGANENQAQTFLLKTQYPGVALTTIRFGVHTVATGGNCWIELKLANKPGYGGLPVGRALSNSSTFPCNSAPGNVYTGTMSPYNMTNNTMYAAILRQTGMTGSPRLIISGNGANVYTDGDVANSVSGDGGWATEFTAVNLNDLYVRVYGDGLASTPFTPLTTGLISYWPMNETSGSTSFNKVPGKFNLNWVGSPTFSSAGIKTTGTQWADTNVSVNTSASQTICIFANQTTPQIGKALWGAYLSSPASQRSFDYHATNTRLEVVRVDNINNYTYYPMATNVITQMHHYCVVEDPYVLNTYNLYVDGKPVNTAVPVDFNDMRNLNLTIGGYYHSVNGQTPEWAGNMRDFAIWNRPLTSLEVSTLYAQNGDPENVIQNLTSGLYYYYDFNTDTNNSVYALGQRHGEVYGSVTRTSVSCPTGSCGNFTSAGAKIDIGRWAVDITANPFHTVNLMARIDSNANIANLLKDNESSIYPAYLLRTSDVSNPANVQFSLAQSGPSGTSGGVLNRGGWQMLTVVYNGINATLYVNGTYKYSTPYTSGVEPGRAGSIGGSGNSDQLIGLMDNVAIWNRVLNQTEISALYATNGTVTFVQNVPPTIDAFSISNTNPIVKNDILDLQFSINDTDADVLAWNTTWYYSSDNVTWINYGLKNQSLGNQSFASYQDVQHTNATGDLSAGITTAWQYWKGGIKVSDGQTTVYANTSSVLIVNTLPNVVSYSSGTTNTSATLVGNSLQFSLSGTDDEMDTVSMKACRGVSDTWNSCTLLCSNLSTVVFDTVTPTTITCNYIALQSDLRNNTAYLILNDTGNVSTAYVTNFYVNHAPAFGNFSYADTTGDTTLLFGETLSYVQFDSSDLEGTLAPNVTITDPQGVVKVSNVPMTLVTGNTYRYSVPVYIDAIGSWNASIVAVDTDGLVGRFSQLMSVSKVTIANTGRVYAYDHQGIPSFAAVQANNSLYGYYLSEIRINSTSNWSTVKTLLRSMKNNSLSATLTWYDDLSSQPSSIAYISANYKDLVQADILLAIRDLKVYVADGTVVSNDSSLIINNITKQIFQNTSNTFPIFIRNYNQSAIDPNYALVDNSIYITAADGNSYINSEIGYLRNSTDLSRSYFGMSPILQSYAATYQNNVITKLRSGVNTSNAYANFIGRLNNGDIVVSNNQSSERQFNITVINNTQPHAYDLTTKRMLSGKPTSTIVLNVSGFSAHIVYMTNLSSIQVSSTDSKSLLAVTPYNLLTNQDYSWSNANAYLMGSSSANPDDGRVIFTDPAFNYPDFYVWYGVAGSEQIQDWNRYSKVVVAAQNWSQPANVLWASNLSNNTQTFGYVSVNTYGSYNDPVGCTIGIDCVSWNRTKWLQDQYIGVDAWTNISPNMNVFIDGLDYGVVNDDGQFGDALKSIVNYVRLAKQRQAILNTYTSYADYATLADFTMRESVCGRWDGTTSAPTYSYENISLEVARAAFHKLHGTTLLAQSFGNITDYQKSYYCYMQTKVLYGDWALFGYNQPMFEYTNAPDKYGWNYFKYPELGTALEDSYNVSGDVYTRRFERGTVAVNTSSHTVSWANNQQVTNLNFCGYYYDNDDGASDEGFMRFVVNGNISKAWNVSDSDLTAFVKTYKCVNVTSDLFYDPTGFYQLEFYYLDNDGNMLNNNGLYMYNGAGTADGVSWWDNQLNNHPVQPQSRSQYQYYGTANWALNFSLTRSFDSSTIDDVTSSIARSATGVEKVNVTFTSLGDWAIPVYDRVQFINKTVFNGVFVGATRLNVTTDSSCNTASPIFGTTTVGSDIWRACKYNDSGSGYYVKAVVPHLSTQSYLIDGNTPPVLQNMSARLIALTGGNQTWNITFQATDADNNNITQCYVNNSGTIDTFTTPVSGYCSVVSTYALNNTVQNVTVYVLDSYNTQSNSMNVSLARAVYDKIETNPALTSNTTIQYFKKVYNVTQNVSDFSSINFSYGGLPVTLVNLTNGTTRIGLDYNDSLIRTSGVLYVPSGTNTYTVDSGIQFYRYFNISANLSTGEAVPIMNISVSQPQFVSGSQAVNFQCGVYASYNNFTATNPMTIQLLPTANGTTQCYQYVYQGVPIYSDYTLTNSTSGDTTTYKFTNTNSSQHGLWVHYYFPELGLSSINLTLNIPYSVLPSWSTKDSSSQQVFHLLNGVYTQETISTDYTYTDVPLSSLVRFSWTNTVAPINALFANLSYTVVSVTPPVTPPSGGGGGGGGGSLSVISGTSERYVVAPDNLSVSISPGNQKRNEFRVTNADIAEHVYDITIIESDSLTSASKWLRFDTGLRGLAVTIKPSGSLSGDTTYIRYDVIVPKDTPYGTYTAAIRVKQDQNVKYHYVTVVVGKDLLSAAADLLFADIYSFGMFCGKDFTPTLAITSDNTPALDPMTGLCKSGDTPVKISVTPILVLGVIGVVALFVTYGPRFGKSKKGQRRR